MASDGSLPCPGGTGRMIRACCAELAGELRQIDRLVHGRQLAAALDRTQRLAARHPRRACLFAVQTTIELALDRVDAAGETARAFLAAHPDNQTAMRQAALTAAITGRIAEAAAVFDRARELAVGMKAAGVAAVADLIQTAPAIVQAAVEAGHPGCGQGIVDWLADTRAVAAEALRPLVALVDSPMVPLALRCRLPLAELEADVSWRGAFDAALFQARDWRLARALDAFRDLEPQAGGCRPLQVNIGLLCELLARPAEAATAWRAVARSGDTPHDQAVDAMSRVIALELEAEPDRGPAARFVAVTAARDAIAAANVDIEAIEARLRAEPRAEETPIDAAAWAAAGAAAPRSAWWICAAVDPAAPAVRQASLLLFDRHTAAGPAAVMRGFATDVAAATPLVERLLSCRFEPAADEPGLPVLTPTAWLLSAEFRLPTGVAADAAERALSDRFGAVWPDTALPELHGRTPRQAVTDPEGRLRVEALILEGEAAANRPALAAAWAAVRSALGLATPGPIVTREPLDDVSPLRWHLVDMSSLPPVQFRGLVELARDAGFDAAAVRAAAAERG